MILFSAALQRLSAQSELLLFGNSGKTPPVLCRAGMSLGTWLAPLPPIAANTIIMPFVIAKISEMPESIPLFAFSVFVGEIVCCGGLGLLLLAALKKHPQLFGRE